MSIAPGVPGINKGLIYSNIKVPHKIDLQFLVDPANANGLGVSSIKSNGFVNKVWMHTTQPPMGGNPNPLAGYLIVQLNANMNTYINTTMNIAPPVTGGALAINGGGLTAHTPYEIVTVGSVPAPKQAITTVADVANSLRSTYFTMGDVFNNQYVFFMVTGGIGTPPSLTGPLLGATAVPVPFATGAANTAVATALATAVAGVNGGASFTTGTVGAVMTATSAAANTNLQFRAAADSTAAPTGFTFGPIVFTSLTTDWDNVGLAPGFAPAIGAPLIAANAGTSLGSGTVKLVTVSGVLALELVGNPNTQIANSNVAQNGGAQLMYQFVESGSPNTVTAPATGSMVSLAMWFDRSNTTVDGL